MCRPAPAGVWPFMLALRGGGSMFFPAVPAPLWGVVTSSHSWDSKAPCGPSSPFSRADRSVRFTNSRTLELAAQHNSPALSINLWLTIDFHLRYTTGVMHAALCNATYNAAHLAHTEPIMIGKLMLS